MSIRNLDAFFSPKSIALIGASHRPHKVGSVVAANLFAGGFEGPVMPVNPSQQTIQSVVAYRGVADLPINPDLAVIATPAETVPAIVRSLGARGCRAAVVISAGFEAEGDGGPLRDLLLAAAGETGMRIIGPNCLGVIAPHSGVNASFAHIKPAAGRIACVMQSGALVASMLEWANSRGIGFSKVISLGDAVDVDFGDILNYLATDPETDAVFLYVEGLSHARKFMAAARALARIKPIIAMKAGRSDAVAHAVRSHTGALAGSDRVYSAAFRRAGIVRVDSLEEMFDAAEILGRPRMPCGPRLAILTNGGGGGILAADAVAGSGLEMAQLSPATLTALDEVLPAQWSHGNPIDIIGDAGGARYARSLAIVVADPGVDSVLVVDCPTAVASSEEAADAIIAARGHLGEREKAKPIVACWMGSSVDSAARVRLSRAGIPIFETPEKAVKSLRFLRDFSLHATLETDVAETPVSAENRVKAAKLLQAALQDGRSWLDEVNAKAVLEAYGIPVAKTMRASTPDAVAEAARSLGCPVALKILSPDIQHKSDVGGVALALATPEAARGAAVAMAERIATARPDSRLNGFTVSPMVVRWDGREAIAGISTDRTFGPVVVFGQGGVATEQVDDVAVALPPLTMAIAQELIKRTRFSRQLEAFRDWPRADLASIGRVLVALGHMAVDHPEISELDINPLVADEHGVIALDARIRVKDPAASVAAAMETHAADAEHAVHDRSGLEVVIRPIHPDDAPGLQRFVEGLDPETIRARFFETMRRLPPAMLARLTQVEDSSEMGFVAVERRPNADADPREDRICGVAHIVIDPNGETGEYALTAAPEAIRRGIAHALLKEAIAKAQARGVRRLCAEELNDSRELIALAHELGANVSHNADDPTVACIVLTLPPVAEAA